MSATALVSQREVRSGFASQRATLPNGLQVIHVPMPAIHSVAVTLFVGLGSRYEPESHAGVAHLIEHLLFKGTARRPTATHISQTVDEVGGILNASTDKELTTYWVKVARDHAHLAIDLLADMVQHSRVTPTDLAKEKQVVVEELRMIADDPQDRVHVLAEEVLWTAQAVGREIAGSPESVGGLKRKDVLEYLRRYYGPNNAVLATAGGVELDEILRFVEEHLFDWTPVHPLEPASAAIDSLGPHVAVERKPTEQVQICVAYPGLHRMHRDRAALDVLTTILGGGTSSRLFTRLRDRLGLAYDVHAYTTYLSDTGSFVVYAGAEAGKVERVLDEAMREIGRLQRRRVPEAELQRTKRFMRGRLWLGLEDPQSVANWFGAQEMLQHEVVTPEEAAAAVDAVTADDVLRLARSLLQPDLARLVAVGPVDAVRLPGARATSDT